MTGTEKRVVFLGLRRGGSSQVFYILSELLRESGHRALDLVKDQQDRGVAIEDISESDLENALGNNALVGVFRDRCPALERVSKYDVRPILLVRDPRDCILSWRHARYLHPEYQFPLSETGESLTDYLNSEQGFARSCEYLLSFAQDRDGLVVKYENLISRPVEVLKLLASALGVKINRTAFDMAVVNANFMQILVDESNHNRFGGPYEAIKRCSKEEIEELNQFFSKCLGAFGYRSNAGRAPSKSLSLRYELDALKRYMLLLARENAYRIIENQEILSKLNNIVESVGRTSSAILQDRMMSSSSVDANVKKKGKATSEVRRRPRTPKSAAPAPKAKKATTRAGGRGTQESG